MASMGSSFITTILTNTLSYTTTLLLLLACALLPHLAISGPLFFSEFISTATNFTASNFRFIDQSGAFLASRGGTFEAVISSPNPELRSFYFSVVHVPSGAVVWSANRDSPISSSATLRLTVDGLAIADEAGKPIWSTPTFVSAVALLQLQESGNLVLLDRFNSSLWESFRNPTDTVVHGQRLLAGENLVGAVNDSDLTSGDYQFVVTGDDAILQWNGLNYWMLSMEGNAHKDSNLEVSYMEINGSGLYLFNGNGSNSILVMRMLLDLGKSDFWVAKLESDGKFVVSSFDGNNWSQQFEGPSDVCRIPFICGKIGICSAAGDCSCPPNFHTDPQTIICAPADSSYSLPVMTCESSNNSSQSNSLFSYIKLSDGIDYFANVFTDPVKRGVNLSVCENLCSQNCSSLGLFHESSSGSCYLLQNYLGSFMSSNSSSISGAHRLGYLKALYVNVPSPENPNGNTRNFPLVGLILLPSFGLLLLLALVVIVIIRLRRKRRSDKAVAKLGRRNSSSSGELEIMYIAGLPVKFEYEDLVAATENFNTQIGSGGFGVVYKGTLQDETLWR